MNSSSPTNNSTYNIYVENGNGSGIGIVEKLPQCDYTQLFSHLPLSFQFIQQTANIQLQIHGITNDQLTQTSTQQSPFLTASTLELLQAQYQQKSAYKLCFALVSLLFGLFYSLIGYRFLKLSSFFIGFTLGSSVIYLILTEQKQLTLVENLIISLSIGVLFAFVALLVQYIGLFLLGITSSTAIVTCILILIDLFYTNKSAWLCIGLLFVCATILASFSLKFQKALTIFNTSCIGCGLLLVAVDFFVENNLLIDYIMELYKVNGNSFNVFERQKALLKSSNDFTTIRPTGQLNTTTNMILTTTTASTSKISNFLTKSNMSSINSSFNGTSVNGATSGALALFLHLYSSAHARLCWYTWLIFGSYFIMLFISLLIQFLVTGKNYDHRDSWQKLIRGSRKKKSANLEKIRLKSHLNEGSHHHHNHHHTNHGNTTISSSNNIDLISGGESSSSLSRNSDLEGSCQNDTLLLVESKKSNIQNYMVSSTNENAPVLNHQKHHKSRSKPHHNQVRRAHHSRKQKKSTLECDSENASSAEIISFEVSNQKKTKSKSNKNHNNLERIETEKTKLSALSSSSSSKPVTQPSSSATGKPQHTLTTTSTSSTTSSSASSTCQLIPLKLNNTTQNTVNESHVVLEGITLQPSAPPCPQTPAPPVPTLPPPKLPNLIASLNTAANSLTKTPSASLVVSNLLVNPANSNITKNISKIKNNNRMSGKEKDAASADDRFRHFYQVRRNNGDVLSQDFMNNIQNKLSSSSNLNNSNLTLNPMESNQSSASRSASLNSKDNNSKRKKAAKKP